ncbi:MAG TPA: hypothetical protein PKH08_07830, partial [Clostridia bacterium]|nr:hypothetical protein [Clostridia bacterium]
NASEDAIPTDQIAFFGEVSPAISEIEKILRDINLDDMTPIQALTLLADLKKKLPPDKKPKGRKQK